MDFYFLLVKKSFYLGIIQIVSDEIRKMKRILILGGGFAGVEC